MGFLVRHSFCVYLCNILIIAAFTFSAHARPLDPLPEEEVTRRLALFDHQPFNGFAQYKVVQFDGYCFNATVSLEFWDPVSQTRVPLDVTVLWPKVQEPVPGILLVPTIRGDSFLEAKVASRLCSNNIATVIADVNQRPTIEEEMDWDLQDRMFMRSLHGLRTVVDFMSTQKFLRPDALGAMGLSLGGITVGLLQAVEPRLRGVVIAAGSGNIPHVMASSIEDHVVLLKQKRMQAFGIKTDSEYENVLREKIKFDPIYFARTEKSKATYMIMVEQDVKVPYINQSELWKALGKPKYELYRHASHGMALVQMAYLYLNGVVDFWRDTMPGRWKHFSTRLSIEEPLPLDL